MPIDSQVVNGRFVGADQSDVTSLEIDQGRFVSVDGDVEAWRTVDASGYFVLPGAVQMSEPGPSDALQMVLQGVTTCMTSVECGVREFPDELERIRSDAVLDVAMCWTPPNDVTSTDIRHARSYGIHIFNISRAELIQEILGELVGATVRVSIRSPKAETLLAAPHDIRIVLTQVDAETLAAARKAKVFRSTGIFLESDLVALNQNDELWEALASGDIDLISLSGSDGGLLQELYAEGVARRGLSTSRLVEICATTPSTAYGLAPGKGSLNPGSDADFVVFDPDQTSELDGISVPGRVVYAQLRGDILLFNNELHLTPGDGKVL